MIGPEAAQSIQNVLKEFEVSRNPKRQAMEDQEHPRFLSLSPERSLGRLETKGGKMQATRITVDEVKARLDRGEPFIFIDARNEKAWEERTGTIPGAIRVPADDVEAHIPEIAHNIVVVTYCTCPNEQSSARVADELLSHGYKNAHPLYGGLDAWKEAGLPMDTKEESRTGSQAAS